MARKYARDNRGRFAPKGAGATARGGRLRTAAGNKRQTQTMKAAGGPAGTTKGKVKRDPGAMGKPAASFANSDASLKSTSRGRRRPTAAESRANGLTPISEIRARKAAEAQASRDANRGAYNRRFQSQRTMEYAAAYRQSGPKGPKYSTIKNPAPEGSAPFGVTGSTYQGRKNAAAGRAARDASKPKRKKTDTQVMQQADRVMGKLAKRQAAVQVDKVGLNEGLRQVRRNNARAARVNGSLASRGLLGKYQRLAAGADAIHMTAAGKGVRRRKN